MNEKSQVLNNRYNAQQALNAVDRLGLALVKRGHVWNNVERRNYEIAIARLKRIGAR